MISKEFRKYQENKFDAFCKVVIRNACTDNRRSRMKREKRFSSLEEMQMDALDLEKVEDTYVTYSRTYKVKGIAVIPWRDFALPERMERYLTRRLLHPIWPDSARSMEWRIYIRMRCGILWRRSASQTVQTLSALVKSSVTLKHLLHWMFIAM